MNTKRFYRMVSVFICFALILSCTYIGLFNIPTKAEESDDPIINYATKIGDCDSSGKVDLIDLVRMKRFLANDASVDEVLSDIKCDAKIDANDLTALTKILLDLDIGDIAYPRIEKTKYETTETIIADVNVMMFGAVGDGVTDDTNAFVNAMASLGTNGGTVYVPAGRYKLSNQVSIPKNVILQGDFANPDIYGASEVKNGSRLEVYTKITDDGGKPFFKVGKFSALRGFMIWYPEQRIFMGGARQYPYTIKLDDVQSNNLRDLYLVNSYNAIDDTMEPHSLETIQNIYMTAMNYGIETRNSSDIGRFENINIGPEWWLESGLANIPTETELKDCMSANSCGFKIHSIDDMFASDITVNGCKSAVSINGGYGKFYNLSINDCSTGIDLSGTKIYGYTFTNGNINADSVAVTTANGCECPLSFYNVDMQSAGQNVIVNSSNVGVALTNCDIDLESNSGQYAIKCNSGYITAVECNIDKTSSNAKCAYVSSNAVKSSFINCNTATTFDYTAEDANKILVSHNNDVLEDINTEIETKRQIKKPAKQRVYNVKDYGIDTTKTQDVSAILQNVINTAANAGGGIVYLPSYDYLLQNPITVKSGVELRGSSDKPHFGTAINSTFVTDYGRNNENGTALITLESNSGLRGLTIDYSETRANGTPYAYTIRGNGSNIYVVNCTVDSAWQVADFMTNKCDNHYIEAVNFGTLKAGIAVGGGSVGGTVRDCQSNPTSNRDSRNTVRDEWYDSNGQCLSTAWALEHVTGYKINNAQNELNFMNFIYGCLTGLSIEGNSSVTSVGHGTDQANDGIYVSGSSNVDIIATELPVKKDTESYAIRLADGYTGETNVINAEVWAVGESGYYCGGGELNVYGSIMSEGGKTAMQVAGGEAKMASSMITRLTTNNSINNYTNNYKVQKNASGLQLYGNITLTNNKAVLHKSSKLLGPDVSSLAISTVATEGENAIDFWKSSYNSTSYTVISGQFNSNNGYLYYTLDGQSSPAICISRTNALNASNMRYIEFDLYIPSKTFFNNCNSMKLEISSHDSNVSQKNIYYDLNYFKSCLPKSGWNHIKLDLTRKSGTTGSISYSAVKLIRMSCSMKTTVNGEIRIRNIKFSPSDYPSGAVYMDTYDSTLGWTCDERVSCHARNDAYYRLGEQIVYNKPTGSVNISNMDYFCFDIYVSDAGLFNSTATSAAIEITSSGAYDEEEITYRIYSFKDTLSDGWNRVTIPLSSFTMNSTTDKNFDSTAADYFRIYTNSDNLGIAVGNLFFGKY